MDDLAALQAELDAVQASRDARKATAVASGAKAALERKLADAKAISDAECKYGDDAIAVHETDGGIVIVHRAEAMRWRSYSAKVNTIVSKKNSEASNTELADAAHNMALSCLVYPARAAYEALVELYPAIPNDLAGKIGELAAGRAKEAAGK